MLGRVLRRCALADPDPSETSASASILDHALAMSILRWLMFVDHSAHVCHTRIAKTLPLSVALATQVDLSLQVAPRIVTRHVL